MFKTKYKLFIISTLFCFQADAQPDTIRFMQYNLLTYGNSSNPVSYKDTRLKTIVQFIQPDIFGTNELYNQPTYSQNIVSNVLGTGWDKGAYSNTTNDIQTNMLFWRSDKFGFVNQVVISSIVRDIIAYRLYYKQISAKNDTIYLTVIIAHLKAGSEPADENTRSMETQAIVNYLNDYHVSGNCFLMGDLNLYSSNEQAYSNLVSGNSANSKFYDPLNLPGNWHSNPSFAGIHTQSTRTSNLSDGGVSGGLDDRFDHILTTNDAMQSLQGIQYLPGSYKAAGQDGNHYNKSVNGSPANTSAPSNVVQALYEMSDHLPVYADFVFDPSKFLDVPRIAHKSLENIQIVNPIQNNDLKLVLGQTGNETRLTIRICNIQGTCLINKELIVNAGSKNVNVPVNIPPGMYLLYIYNNAGLTVRKIVKQ